MYFVRNKQRWLNWKLNWGLLALCPHFYSGTHCLLMYKSICPNCCMTSMSCVYISLKNASTSWPEGPWPKHWTVRPSAPRKPNSICGKVIQGQLVTAHIFPKSSLLLPTPDPGQDHSWQTNIPGSLKPLTAAMVGKGIHQEWRRQAEFKPWGECNKDGRRGMFLFLLF